MKADLKFIQRLCSLPFLLILLAFLFPLVSVSCSEREVANPNVYELVAGVTPQSILGEEEQKAVEQMKEREPQIKTFMEQPIQTTQVVVPIVAAVVLAAIFAFLSPAGSLAMGLAALISLWVFMFNLSVMLQREHYDFLTVKPAVGAYCVSFLLLIGIAMNLAVIIRLHREKKKILITKD